MSKKKDIVKSLLVACKDCEAQYIVRSLQGKLRIGLAEKTVICALAHAIVLTSEKFTKINADVEAKMARANEIIRSVYSEVPSYDIIIPVLLKSGVEQLQKEVYLRPGLPVHPMLAQPTKGITEVLDRFSGVDFTCEYKYDGERAQVKIIDKFMVLTAVRSITLMVISKSTVAIWKITLASILISFKIFQRLSNLVSTPSSWIVRQWLIIVKKIRYCLSKY